ncbi:hypothetical protein EVAR_84800_1 [Eumeta japonica]|uniref:Uncharacterized protein n=1 Tax=Eumeta variegata TaxID=151549 RepID=A0A4C1U8Y3_EUMVA|nr:hypothetical protein EVAR_84800_1 [Eumeta japonica]
MRTELALARDSVGGAPHTQTVRRAAGGRAPGRGRARLYGGRNEEESRERAFVQECNTATSAHVPNTHSLFVLVFAIATGPPRRVAHSYSCLKFS